MILLLLIVYIKSMAILLSALPIAIIIVNLNKLLLSDNIVPQIVVEDDDSSDGILKMQLVVLLFVELILEKLLQAFWILNINKFNSLDDDIDDTNDIDDSGISSFVIVFIKSANVRFILLLVLLQLIHDHAKPYLTVFPGINLVVTIVGAVIGHCTDDDDNDDGCDNVKNWRKVLTVLFFPVIQVNQQTLFVIIY